MEIDRNESNEETPATHRGREVQKRPAGKPASMQFTQSPKIPPSEGIASVERDRATPKLPIGLGAPSSKVVAGESSRRRLPFVQTSDRNIKWPWGEGAASVQIERDDASLPIRREAPARRSASIAEPKWPLKLGVPASSTPFRVEMPRGLSRR